MVLCLNYVMTIFSTVKVFNELQHPKSFEESPYKDRPKAIQREYFPSFEDWTLCVKSLSTCTTEL